MPLPINCMGAVEADPGNMEVVSNEYEHDPPISIYTGDAGDDGACHAHDTYSVIFCNVVIDNIWCNDFRSHSHNVDFVVNP